VGLAAWVTIRAHQDGDHGVIRLLQCVGLILLATFVTLARTPIGGAVLAADPLHLLWPVTGLTWLALAWGAGRAWTGTHDVDLGGAARWTVAGLVALALVVCGVTATRTRTFGGFGEGLIRPIAHLEHPTIAAARGHGPVLVAATGWSAQLYARGALLEALERAGIATVTPDRDRASRRYRPGTRTGATIWVISSRTPPRAPAAGARLVALVHLRTPHQAAVAEADRRRLRTLLDHHGTVALRDGPHVRLAEVEREYFHFPGPGRAGADTIPGTWLSVDAYIDLYRAGMIVSPKVTPATVDALFHDAVGRYFAETDEVIAVYIRDGPRR